MESDTQSTPISVFSVINAQPQPQPQDNSNPMLSMIKSKSRFIELDVKHLQSWLSKHEVHGDSDLPPVPLCRLVGNEAIRSTKDSILDMAEKFKRVGYLPTLGKFLVAEQMLGGEIIRVTEEEEEAWDQTFWGNINPEFDRELAKSESWKHLVGQKLSVLDGNHRLKAWSSEINGACRDDPTKYVRVKCSVAIFSPKEECSMLLALDWINSLTQTHIKRTLASEIFLFQELALGNEESWKKYFDEKSLCLIEEEMKDEKKKHPWIWWKLPLGMLMQLVYSVEFKAELDKKITENQLYPFSKDYDVHYMECVCEVEDYLKTKKGFKMTSIANPSLGEDWFDKLYALDWESDHNVTMDKLLVLVQTKIQPYRKAFALDRLISKDVGKEWGSEGGEKDWRIYVARFSYWEAIAHRAIELIKEHAMDIYLEDPSAPINYFNTC